MAAGRSCPIRQVLLPFVVACGLVGACTPVAPDASGRARAGAILGGAADTTHDAVMALLQMETATTAYTCSGTTIAQTGTSAFLLTAAHCVVKHDENEAIVLPPVVASLSVMTVVPGPDWQTSYSQGRRFSVTAIALVPGYDGSTTSGNDLAVVRYVNTTAAAPVIPILEPRTTRWRSALRSRWSVTARSPPERRTRCARMWSARSRH